MNSERVLEAAAPLTIVCPRDHSALIQDSDIIRCQEGHRYRIADGVPILLVSDVQQTHIEGTRALAIAETGDLSQLRQIELAPGEIDPFVRDSIGATNGSLYQHLVGYLREYPIPDLRLPRGEEKTFLEIGCNWGRWCIAAVRSGYHVTGIDPSLKGIRAARRVAKQLNVNATYVVGDGRYLPLPDASVDQAFSYSVLQHLSKEHVRLTLSEIRRVLKPGGNCLAQLPNKFGARCLYHQARRGFREAKGFEVRYWWISELKAAFEELIGPSSVTVDGYLSLNAQISDVRFLPRRYKALVYASEGLRRVSTYLSPLIYLADSLYVSAKRM